MLGLILCVALLAATAATTVVVTRVDEGHALAGLFGDSARERVIAERTARLIADAESQVRLASFADSLAAKAWKGVPVAITRTSRRWSRWTFADGSAWMVRHRHHAPANLRRLIVAGASYAGGVVGVDAYGPGGGCPASVLEVTDALTTA